MKEIIANHDKLNSCLMQKVSKLENEKVIYYIRMVSFLLRIKERDPNSFVCQCVLSAQSAELQNQIEELKAKAENTEQYLSVSDLCLYGSVFVLYLLYQILVSL